MYDVPTYSIQRIFSLSAYSYSYSQYAITWVEFETMYDKASITIKKSRIYYVLFVLLAINFAFLTYIYLYFLRDTVNQHHSQNAPTITAQVRIVYQLYLRHANTFNNYWTIERVEVYLCLESKHSKHQAVTTDQWPVTSGSVHTDQNKSIIFKHHCYG